MAPPSLSSGVLPACADFSSVTNPSAYCAPCYFHADSTVHSFPHSLRTIDVGVIPYVTTSPNGQIATSYSTISAPGLLGGNIFTNSNELTWTVDGLVLTAPTTYVDYDDLYGTGIRTTAAAGTTYCADPRRASEILTPTPLDRASLIFPLSAVQTAVSNKSLPIQVQGYLEGFGWFEQRMKSNLVSSCLPTTAEFVTTITCTIDPISWLPIPLTTTTCFATTESGSAVNTCETGIGGFSLSPLATTLPATTTTIPILTSLTESPYPTTVETKRSATLVNFQTQSPQPMPGSSGSVQPASTPASSTASQSSPGVTTIAVTSTVVVPTGSSISVGDTTIELRVSGPAVTISGTVYTAVPSAATTGVGSYIMCGVSQCPHNGSSVAPASSSVPVVPPAGGGSTQSIRLEWTLWVTMTFAGIVTVWL